MSMYKLRKNMLHSDERFHVEGESKEVLQATLDLFVKAKKPNKIKGYVTDVTKDGVPFIEFHWWTKDVEVMNLLETENTVLLTELVYDFLQQKMVEFRKNVRADDIDGSLSVGWTVDYKGSWTSVFRAYPSYRYYAK